MSLCKCGCGKEVKDGNSYIHGHNRHGKASYTSGEKWSMKYSQCQECGTTDFKHAGKGLCSRCYKVHRYVDKKKGVGLWAKKYTKCAKCGTTTIPHVAKGLCTRCYGNSVNRAKGVEARNFGQWSQHYDKCTKCGTTNSPHVKGGLCYNCYEESKRDLSNCEKCPVCGVYVENLNQHLTMKSKKCKDHYDYQYTMFKQYFDSDLSLGSISKELDGMDRHTITRRFIKFFGKVETKRRNELVGRCNISEKAVINYNAKNRFGTIVEYNSPNQGTIKLRSKLEAKYASILDDSSIDWYYEPKSFPYLDKKGKRRTYTPDFYLPTEDKYIEVKGFKKVDDEYKVNYLLNNGINIEMITQDNLKELKYASICF